MVCNIIGIDRKHRQLTVSFESCDERKFVKDLFEKYMISRTSKDLAGCKWYDVSSTNGFIRICLAVVSCPEPNEDEVFGKAIEIIDGILRTEGQDRPRYG